MAKNKKTKQKPVKNPYVQRETIWKAVGGGFNNPGESKVVSVGRHKVLLKRSEKLDKNGNPIHTATVLDKHGNTVSSYRSNGSATNVVSTALKKCGVETKYRKKFPKPLKGKVKR